MILILHRYRRKSRPHKARGVALISVILITAIVTSMVVSLSSSQAFSIKKTSNLLEQSRISLTIEALETKAKETLIADLKVNQTDDAEELGMTSVIRTTSADLPRANLQGQGRIHNLGGLFNLSNLDSNFGANTVRGAGGGGGAPLSSTAQSANGLAQANALSQQAPADGNNNAPNFGDTPSQAATPRLCNDTLTCEWWQYAPQGFEQAPRAFDDNSPEPVAANTQPSGPATQAFDPDPASAQELDPATEPTRDAACPAPNTEAAKTKLSPQEVAQKRLVNLFNALDIETDLIPALLDWIDADTTARYPNGAEDDYYMDLERPYRAANRGLTSIRELMLIKGFDREVYEKLKSHLVILPSATDINVNTASKEILMSLSPLIDSASADMLISAREVQAFQSVEAFLEHPLVRGRFVDADGLSVDSEFFSLKMTVSNERLSMTASTQLHRFNQQVEPIRRSQGFLP